MRRLVTLCAMIVAIGYTVEPWRKIAAACALLLVLAGGLAARAPRQPTTGTELQADAAHDPARRRRRRSWGGSRRTQRETGTFAGAEPPVDTPTAEIRTMVGPTPPEDPAAAGHAAAGPSTDPGPPSAQGQLLTSALSAPRGPENLSGRRGGSA